MIKIVIAGLYSIDLFLENLGIKYHTFSTEHHNDKKGHRTVVNLKETSKDYATERQSEIGRIVLALLNRHGDIKIEK